MDDSGRGRGGRGSALLNALQASRKPGGDGDQPKAPATGRGQLLQALLAKQSAKVPSGEEAKGAQEEAKGAQAGGGELKGSLAAALGARAIPPQAPLQPTTASTAAAPPAGATFPAAEAPPKPMGRARVLQSLLSQSGPKPPSSGTTQMSLKDLLESSRRAEIAVAPAKEPTPAPPRLAPPSASAPSVAATRKAASPGGDRGASREGEGPREWMSTVEHMVYTMNLGRSEPVVRIGEGPNAKKKTLAANCVRIKSKSNGLFQYSVGFMPTIDAKMLRRRIVEKLTHALDQAVLFDGAILFLPKKLPQDETILNSTMPTDGSPLQIVLRLTKLVPPEYCRQAFGVAVKAAMQKLKLVEVGRHYYNPMGSISVPQHRLEVWPGYVTALSEHEGGIMLTIDVTHRVLRTETVLDLMRDIKRKVPAEQFKEEVAKKILGLTILTRYNNKTYRVDDICWDANPKSKFLRKGEEISYIEYFKMAYGRDIQDHGQPLLIFKEKPRRGPPGREPDVPKLISLIPELSYTTGLTDEMRADFRVMKDVSSHTRVSPEGRQETMRSFIRQLNGNPEARKELEQWGLELEVDTIYLDGRQLDPEMVKTARQEFSAGEQADWGKFLGRDHLIDPRNLKNWILIFTIRDKAKAMDFLQAVKRYSDPFGMKVNDPTICELTGDRTEQYLQEIKKKIVPGVTDIVVSIFPTSRDDRYNAIKKFCYVECPVASQVIITKTISHQDKLRSVVQKIMLQVNCKLGGTLWAVKIPIKSLMVVGIDVYHDGKGRSAKSVGGLVASMNEVCTSWYSRVAFQEPGQELVDSLKVALIQCLRKFHEMNHYLPQTIVIYRDGVGDGQLGMVSKYEVPQFLSCFDSFGPDYKPRFAMIIVQKRINTRIFGVSADRALRNPAPGTILDHTITRRDLFDFFLVSQHVRQGTVSPTHYIVINETGKWQVDHIQKLTYKMTHLYYNWPGTIRVPAPCQYAHKLAQMVGMNIKKMPAESMCDRLFYL